MALFHFLDDFPDIGLLALVARIHLHGKGDEVSVQEQRLSDDWLFSVFLARAFLPVILREVNLKVVVRAVEEQMTVVSLVELFVAVIEQFYIFLIVWNVKLFAGRNSNYLKLDQFFSWHKS